MTDEETEDRELIELYRRYREAIRATAFEGRYMPYEWTRLPERLNPRWLPYSQMLDGFARELANAINDLTNHVLGLRAWATMLPSLSEHQKINACHEFIDGYATVALNLPYALRSRFRFATAHLSHQANVVHDRSAWVDDLPKDRNISSKHVDERGEKWKAYPVLKQEIEGLFGYQYI